MIRLLVGCTIFNLLVGLLSYFTLEVHKWQFLVIVSVLNIVCLSYEAVVIFKQRSAYSKAIGVGFARNLFFIAALFSMKFYLDMSFGILFYLMAFIGSILIFRRVIARGEALFLSVVNAGAVVLGLSLIPWKISETKIPMQITQSYPGQGVLRKFSRYAGQVGVEIDKNEQRFNVAKLETEYTLIKIRNFIGGKSYFLE